MKKILLSTALSVALIAPVLAVEAGKMYMRGDANYAFSNLKGVSLNNNTPKELKGFGADLGIGYAFSDEARTEVTLNFLGNTDKSKTDKASKAVIYAAGESGKTSVTALKDQPASLEPKERGISLMGNVYYDFYNGSAFTPYIGAGLGVVRSRVELKYTGNTTAAEAATTTTPAVAAVSKSFTVKSGSRTSLGYQIGFGVAYEVAKDLHVDLGYKFSGHTNSKYKTKFATGESVKIGSDDLKEQITNKSNIVSNTVNVGVRFAF